MKLSAFERECEHKIKKLINESSDLGVIVRREKLTRGPSFRVKSGNCLITGKRVVFIDRRLPVEQQLSILRDEIEQPDGRSGSSISESTSVE
jgi:hypothetical protein